MGAHPSRSFPPVGRAYPRAVGQERETQTPPLPKNTPGRSGSRVRSPYQGLLSIVVTGAIFVSSLGILAQSTDDLPAFPDFDIPLLDEPAEGSATDEMPDDLLLDMEDFELPTGAEESGSGWSTRHTHRLEFQTRFSTRQKAPLPGQADYRGLTMTRALWVPELQIDSPSTWRVRLGARSFYDGTFRIKGRDEYTRETLDEYEWESELREATVSGSLSQSLDVTLGRQIVSWGYSDFLRAVDVLNPLDQRDPGLTDLADIRLPVTMTRWDYYAEPFRLQFVTVHEFESNRLVPFGAELYPAPINIPRHNEPDYWDQSAAWGAQLQYEFAAGITSLYAANIHDPLPRIAFDPTIGTASYDHDRVTVLGWGMQASWGDWLFKTELAWSDGYHYSLNREQYSRADWIFGFDYLGWRDTTITVEYQGQRRNSFDSNFSGLPEFAQYAPHQGIVAYRREFPSNDLVFSALLFFSDRRGTFQRWTLEKGLRNDLSLELGYIGFQNGDHPLAQQLENADKLFVRLRGTF